MLVTGTIGNERAPNAPEPESQSPGEDANLFPKLLLLLGKMLPAGGIFEACCSFWTKMQMNLPVPIIMEEL